MRGRIRAHADACTLAALQKLKSLLSAAGANTRCRGETHKTRAAAANDGAEKREEQWPTHTSPGRRVAACVIVKKSLCTLPMMS